MCISLLVYYVNILCCFFENENDFIQILAEAAWYRTCQESQFRFDGVEWVFCASKWKIHERPTDDACISGETKERCNTPITRFFTESLFMFRSGEMNRESPINKILILHNITWTRVNDTAL